jgi:hypothetical protein
MSCKRCRNSISDPGQGRLGGGQCGRQCAMISELSAGGCLENCGIRFTS